jgi:hypothetical protein
VVLGFRHHKAKPGWLAPWRVDTSPAFCSPSSSGVKVNPTPH